jgi:hypothetical protein
MIRATQADVDRFMSYVDVLPSGCWFWAGARSRGKGNRKWYGSFRVGGIVVRAHRFAHDVIGGKACLPGYHRDHSCRFSLCVNPDHIDAVTHARNEELKRERSADVQLLFIVRETILCGLRLIVGTYALRRLEPTASAIPPRLEDILTARGGTAEQSVESGR